MGAWIDITGIAFGHWTVIEYAGSSAWKCICNSCSTIHFIKSQSLKEQKYGMCIGCWHRSKQIHGHTTYTTQSRAYKAWSGMLQRCGNPNGRGYYRYGGRGIRVCEEWKQFENFFRDMGNPPPGLSIGRINNDGNYEPSNCRWETRLEQGNNRGVCRFVTYEGHRMTVADFARLVDTLPSNIYKALARAKCPRDEAPRIVQVLRGAIKRFVLC